MTLLRQNLKDDLNQNVGIVDMCLKNLRPPEPFIWRAPHHIYYGAAFVIFALFMKYMCDPWWYYESLNVLWYTLIGLGSYLVIDDLIEHLITKDTPARILWEKIVYPIILAATKRYIS